MTPVFWLLRSLNLAAVLTSAFFAGSGASLALPAGIFAAAAAAEAAAVFLGRVGDARLRRWIGLYFSLINAALVLWLSFREPRAAAGLDAACLLPAVLVGSEFGALAGALAGLALAALTASAFGGVFSPALLPRAMFFVLAPAAAGVALAGAHAQASSRTRRTIARLRAAQVGEYISYVLFQLRDYMTTIVSVGEALALSAPKDDPKFAERIERLRRSTAELNGKMLRLLGEKSPLTAVSAPTKAATDLAALVRAVADEARAAFAPPGATVSVLVQGELPPARTERRPIELAVLAVLQNSLEACAERGGRVTVRLRRREEAVEIEVADDGGGVPEPLQPLLFEPIASARRAHGMGLGLSMSRRFLERLGGTVRLKSDGVHTAVLLVVPLDRELPKIRNEESTWAGRRGGS